MTLSQRSWDSDLDAELSVIGAALQSKEALDKTHCLAPSDFTDPALAHIFQVMLALSKSGQPVDLLTVSAQAASLTGQDISEALAMKAMQFTPTVVNAQSYVDIVKACRIRRELHELGTGIVTACQNRAYSLSRIKARALERLDEVQLEASGENTRAMDLVMAGYTYAERQCTGESQAGLTGIAELDTLTGGMHKGELTILAARPGIGKTTFAWQVADCFARRGQKVLFVSCEMSKEQLATRWFAQQGLSSDHIRKGKLDDAEWEQMGRVANELSALPILTNHRLRTVASIAEQVKALQRTDGLGLLVIDYLQLLQSGKPTPNANAEVSALSKSLKELSLSCNIPILCLSQLSREAAKRDSIFPKLTDLRDSGAIEQDADNVLFLARAEEETQVPSGDKALLERAQSSGNQLIYLDLAKHRQGATGRLAMLFCPRTMRLYSRNEDLPVQTPKAIAQW